MDGLLKPAKSVVWPGSEDDDDDGVSHAGMPVVGMSGVICCEWTCEPHASGEPKKLPAGGPADAAELPPGLGRCWC